MRWHGRPFIAPLLVGVVVTSACTGRESPPVELSFAPADRLPKVELWDARTGWRELPPSPVEAPAERWRIRLTGSHATAHGVIAILEQTGDGVIVRRIDPATGADLWAVPVPGLAMPAEIQVDGGGSLITVASDATTGGIAVLDAVDGRIIWRGGEKDTLPSVDAVAEMIIVAVGTGTRGIERATGAQRWQTEEFLTVSGPVLLRNDPLKQIVGVVDPVSGAPIWEKPRGDFSDPQTVGDTLVLTRDEDGSQDSVSAFDLATGGQRWQTSIPDIGRAEVTAMDDDLVLITGGGGLAETGTAVVTLSSGEVRWRPEHGATPMRIDGEPHVLIEGGGLTVRRGTTGEVVSSVRLPAAAASTLAGGASYRAGGAEVVAVRLPDLAGQWRTSVSIQDAEVPAPIPGGFVVEEPAGSGGQLVGYLGSR